MPLIDIVKPFIEDWLARPGRPQAGPLTLTQRRIFILPTKYGFGFAPVLLVMLAGSVSYGLSLGFVLTFLLGSVAIVSILHAYRNLAELRVAPRPCRAGLRRRHRALPGPPRKPVAAGALLRRPRAARRGAGFRGHPVRRPGDHRAACLGAAARRASRRSLHAVHALPNRPLLRLVADRTGGDLPRLPATRRRPAAAAGTPHAIGRSRARGRGRRGLRRPQTLSAGRFAPAHRVEGIDARRDAPHQAVRGAGRGRDVARLG